MKQFFTPLGIDHLVIVCDDNAVWSLKLERLGFVRVKALQKEGQPDVDEYKGISAVICPNGGFFLWTKARFFAYIELYDSK